MFKHFISAMPKNWPTGVAGAVTFSVILGYFFTNRTFPSLMISAVSSGIAAIATIFLFARHDARLVARMKNDAPLDWGIWMNGVQIGFITDAEYAAIQRYAFGNGRLVVAQAFNLGRVVMNITGKVFIGMPVLMFWLFVVALIAAPESINEFARAWRTAELATLTASFSTLFNFVALVSVLSIFVMFVLGHRFGFLNQYDDAVARMIRQQCKTPIDGDIHLLPIYAKN